MKRVISSTRFTSCRHPAPQQRVFGLHLADQRTLSRFLSCRAKDQNTEGRPTTGVTDAEQVRVDVEGVDEEAADDGEEEFYDEEIRRRFATCTPILTLEEVADRMYDAVHESGRTFFKSFFSSVYGGIVTDPAMFMLPIDDHMVHRGHAVFDTAIMVEGNLYQLDAHLERFFKSAAAARIPPFASVESIRRIILDTAAASACPNGFVRYWMSAGRGGFGLSGSETFGPEFYCICYNGPHRDLDPSQGWVAKTTPVPNKPAYFAELKSVNYLPNTLNLMDAEDAGVDLGIFVKEDGTLAEGPTVNVGIITQEGVVKFPTTEGCLAGCIMSRLIEMVPEFAEQNLLEGIVGIVQGPITLEEAYRAKEVFVAGGAIPVAGITEWDARIIGDGQVGVGTLVLRQLIMTDMSSDYKRNPYGQEQLTPVPYGILTGMIEDVGYLS